MAVLASQHYHLVPGRLRIKLARLKRNDSGARIAERRLCAIVGVRNVTANTLTGSVVVRFDPALAKVSSILDALKALGLMDSAAQPMIEGLAPVSTAPLADKLAKRALETLVERCALALVAALI
jgi:CheY-specific phosphatase CheX